MTGPTVVANAERLTKAQLHAKVMRGWARGIDRHGKGTFADRIECSIQALDKQLAGSLPTLETIDRAMDAEPSVLDDYFEAKGKRLVDKEAVCDADDCGLLIARVLVMLNEAEHPNGPGGRAIVPPGIPRRREADARPSCRVCSLDPTMHRDPSTALCGRLKPTNNTRKTPQRR
ncbi:hypothetical protein [Sphingomonas sp. Ant20]|uniref:hypothetical protein n=1 Tax=Sphingomonas sp. Ant20 TaxID=104605 RepID=UPI000FE13EE8|nr:hypothetical protein [Sphingomonas sp. Ant20]